MRRNEPGRGLALLCVSVMFLGAGCATPSIDRAAAGATDAPAASAAARSLPDRLRAYFDALNANDAERLFAFYEDGVTESFRARRSQSEDRALYEMLTRDLGQLEIKRMERESDDEVIVVAYSASRDMPVTFAFRIADERIDGLSVRPGESEHGRPKSPVQLAPDLSDAQLFDQLDVQLVQLAKQDRFSGGVLLARDGTVVFERAYGLANRKTGLANDISTAFDIGSITKLLTRIAVAQLAEQGKLALDGLVQDYLPDYPNRSVARQVTVQHLLDHSSGLGDIFNERWDAASKESFIHPRDFFPLFADAPLEFEPGTGRAYSNAGFVVLGAIVEAASGMAYADYLETHVFAPAGMTRSGMERRDGSDPLLAIGYTRASPDAPLVDNLGQLPIAGCPAGSSMHTTSDLFRLDRALRDGRLLGAQWTAWVYGHATVANDASYPMIVAGGAHGVSTAVAGNGAVTVIVLSNFDPPAGEALAESLFGLLADH